MREIKCALRIQCTVIRNIGETPTGEENPHWITDKKYYGITTLLWIKKLVTLLCTEDKNYKYIYEI